MTSVHFQGKSFNITVIQLYVPTTNAKEAEFEQFYEDLQDLLELTPKKDSKKLFKRWEYHLICLLRNLYAGQEATVKLDMEQQTGSK